MILKGMNNEQRAIIRAKQLLKFVENNEVLLRQYIICVNRIVHIKVYDVYDYLHTKLNLFIDSGNMDEDYKVNDDLDNTHIIDMLDMLSGCRQLSKKPEGNDGLYSSVLSEPLVIVGKDYAPHVSKAINVKNQTDSMPDVSKFRYLVVSLCTIHNYLVKKS